MSSTEAEKDVFLLAGKGSRRTEMVRFFKVALAECGAPKPRVAYIGTASDDDLDFFRELREPLLAAGAAAVTLVPLADGRGDEFAAKRFLSSCDAVFVNGGDVYAGMEGLKRYGLDSFLREMYHQGKVFLGLSAGLIMLGQYWVNWDEAKGGDQAEVFECLGLVPTSFDAHAEDDGWDELKTLLTLLGPGSEGHGIPSGGMVKVDPQGRITELGKRPNVPFINEKGKVVAAKATC